jgi:hypothetical protein
MLVTLTSSPTFGQAGAYYIKNDAGARVRELCCLKKFYFF